MASPVVQSSVGSFIPASQRPDGTWRKQRRVKDGYTPQDEVPLYESRGKQFAKARDGYISGMDPELISAREAEKEAAIIQEAKKTKKKKPPPPHPICNEPLPSQLVAASFAAEKKMKSENKANAPLKVEEKWEVVGKPKTGKEGTAKAKKDPTPQPKDNPQNNSKAKKQTSKQKTKEPKQQPQSQNAQQSEIIEPAKRLRNLRKKIKEIEALEARLKSKELKNPEKEQLEKIARKHEIEAEISTLEAEIANLDIKSK